MLASYNKLLTRLFDKCLMNCFAKSQHGMVIFHHLWCFASCIISSHQLAIIISSMQLDIKFMVKFVTSFCKCEVMKSFCWGSDKQKPSREGKKVANAQCNNLRVRGRANGQKSPPPPHGGLFIGRRRWLFVFIPLVGSNIIRRSLEFTNMSLEFTNRSLNAVNKALDLTNKPLNHYFGPLLYTKVCLPLANLRRTPIGRKSSTFGFERLSGRPR